MRYMLATAILLMTCSAALSQGVMHISNDRGGRIGTYLDKYAYLSSSNDRVVVQGFCASACTLVLSKLPRERICMMPGARLMFHAAYDILPDGRHRIAPESTQMMYDMYPPHIRNWIARNGGLTRKDLWLQGKALAAMYPTCREQAPVFAQQPGLPLSITPTQSYAGPSDTFSNPHHIGG